MKIALLGTRGIPASYSGFETCVEQLGQRLVERGHEVTVYCRSHHISYKGEYYKGMRLVKLPTISNKYLDTIVHSFISSLHALGQGYDIALYFIAGNSPVSWIPRLVGTRTLLNVDGLDWKREKWPALAKKYIQFSEYLATKLPNIYLTDLHVVQNYYHDHYHNEPPYIPYGSEVEIIPPGEILANFGLEPRRYVLFVGRLVPENCAHHLVEAFHELQTDLKCVIVGDAPYAEEYQAELRRMAAGDPRIIFTGYVFGKGYHELGSNAAFFVESSGVGGTSSCVSRSDGIWQLHHCPRHPRKPWTLGGAGLAYDGKKGAANLRQALQHLLLNPQLVADFRRKASTRAQACYNWEAVTDAYEDLFEELVKN